MALDVVPVEIFLQILRYVEVVDVISLRKTCRSLRDRTYHRSLWFDILQAKIVCKGIPTPGTTELNVSSASARELEDVCVRALVLQRNWTSSRPKFTSSISFNLRDTESFANNVRKDCTSPLDPLHLRCLALYFLPDRGNRYLVVILRREQMFTAGPQTQRSFELQCWDISKGDDVLGARNNRGTVRRRSRCVARYQCTSLLAACVNADPTHPACLVVTRRVEPMVEDRPTSFALSIDFSSVNPLRNREAFREYSSFPSFKTAIRLHGPLFYATDDTHSIRIIDINTGNLLYLLKVPLLHLDATVFPEEYKCLNSVVIGNFALMFRQQWIHLYGIPDWNPTDITEAIELQHIAEYKWPFRVDSIDVMPKQHHPLQHQFVPLDPDHTQPTHTPPPPIHILLRFASIFPWPVNILHTYILPANTSFDMEGRNGELENRNHLPYLPPDETAASEGLKPHAITAIDSPVRLFTPSDTALGAYGTVLWMDAQTEASNVAHAEDRGQRVAGRVLDFTKKPRRRDADVLPGHASGSVASVDGNDGQAGPSSHRLADEGEAGGQNAMQGRRGMVFHVQEESSDWARIAMCEEEGMIAIGTTKGEVSVYKYA
ncbi:hypothetical protein BC835DRAFT_1417453 [Cytidiella melzeri]|nr:hypothetical protein BC835DRAFT_1417453 [Cytidiella melzeri]